MGFLRRRPWILSTLSVVVVFGLLIWQLVRGWHSLPPGFFQNVKAAPLVGSLVGLILALLLVSLRWGLTLQAMGVSIDRWSAVKIWFLSQVGRYAPGGVWNYVARFYLGRAEMPGQAVVTSMILETGLRTVSEMLVFLLSIPLWPQKRFLTTSIAFLAVGSAVLGLGLLHPAFLRWLVNLRVVPRASSEAIDLSGVRYCTMLKLLVYYMLSVIIVGGAFFLLVSALYPVSANLFPPIAGSLAASVVVGFLCPLVPNGWGIREGVLTFLLAQILPIPVSVVVAIASRIWLTTGEAFWIILMMGLQRRKGYF